MSSTRTPPTCGFCRRCATARCLNADRAHTGSCRRSRRRTRRPARATARRRIARAARWSASRYPSRRARSFSATSSAKIWRTRSTSTTSCDVAGDHDGAARAERAVNKLFATLGDSAARRRSASGHWPWCRSSVCLVLHGVDHDVPLFLASFAGFLAALPGIAALPKMRALAMREARQEYAEYYLPLPAVPLDHAAERGGVLRSMPRP